MVSPRWLYRSGTCNPVSAASPFRTAGFSSGPFATDNRSATDSRVGVRVRCVGGWRSVGRGSPMPLRRSELARSQAAKPYQACYGARLLCSRTLLTSNALSGATGRPNCYVPVTHEITALRSITGRDVHVAGAAYGADHLRVFRIGLDLAAHAGNANVN